MKKGLRLDREAQAARGLHSETSPDEEGIKTLLRRRRGGYICIRRQALMKKGLRLVINALVPVRPIRRQALMKKGLRQLDGGIAVADAVHSETSPDEEGIKTAPEFSVCKISTFGDKPR